MDIWAAVVLIIFGVIFLLLEIFVFPGIGVTGIVGSIALILGVIIAFNQSAEIGMYTLASVLVSASILIYVSVKTDSLSKMALSRNIESKVEMNEMKKLKIGEEGITVSRLAPMGKARFGNIYSEVSSWEGYVEENTPIRIEKFIDNTIFVSSII
jgi:membrane-bound ClpP family serine protease